MKLNNYFLGVVCFLTLTACSQEVGQENTGEIHEDSTTVPVQEIEVKEQTLSESEKQEETLNVDDENNGNSTQKNSEIKTDLNDNSREGDIYEHYTSNYTNEADVTNKVKDNEVAPVYTVIDETTIELPLYKDNEKFFSEGIKEVSLEELERNGAVEFVEEPIEQGFLIGVDLHFLTEKYPAESYSLEYGGEEYPLMVSDVYPTTGLTVVANVKVEDLKSANILIMN